MAVLRTIKSYNGLYWSILYPGLNYEEALLRGRLSTKASCIQKAVYKLQLIGKSI